MRILVDGVDVAESAHASQKILLDTMILCYAHDRLSPHHDAASLIIKALYEESVSFGKLLPSAKTYIETFESAKHLSIVDDDIFDCVLAYTCKGNVDTLWTENTKHFKKYSFLKVENH